MGFAQLTLDLLPSNYSGYGVSYFGAKNGSINLTVMGGSAPYTYQWSNEESTQDIGGLAAGYYEVIVTDANGESAEGRITLEAPERLEVFLTKYEYPNEYNVSCYNCYNGTIYVDVVGGTPPYSYQWNDGTSTGDRYYLGARDYQVFVTDANGTTVESKHIELRGPERQDWTMGGNAGTDPSINFLGTSDNQDLVFKSNSQERLRIKGNGTISFPDLGVALASGQEGVLKIGPGGNILVSVLDKPDPSYAGPFWKTDGNFIGSTSGGFLGTTNSQPLIIKTDGVERLRVSSNGKVGIGTNPPNTSTYGLFVEDGILSREIKVLSGPWPDFVFEKSYPLLCLSDYRKFISQNKHLPGIPSAKEVSENGGVELGAMQSKILQVVEEQALYILQLEESLNTLSERIAELEKAGK